MAGAPETSDHERMTMKPILLEAVEVAGADDIRVRPDPSTGHLRLILNDNPLEDDQSVTLPASVLARLVDPHLAVLTGEERPAAPSAPTSYSNSDPWLSFLPRLRGHPMRIGRV